MRSPSAAQCPVMTVALTLRRVGIRNQGKYPGGVSSGGPEKFEVSPAKVQVRSPVSTRVIETNRGAPVRWGLHVITGS